MNQPQTPDNEVARLCPHCGGKWDKSIQLFYCETSSSANYRTDRCREREMMQKAEAEVARLRERLEKAEDLIRGLHDGWKKARTAHLETCKNAQAEIDKLHTENVCLQELIQEFYEWSRRDYPTEAEVREIMDRYYNLLNHNSNNKPS